MLSGGRFSRVRVFGISDPDGCTVYVDKKTYSYASKDSMSLNRALVHGAYTTPEAASVVDPRARSLQVPLTRLRGPPSSQSVREAVAFAGIRRSPLTLARLL